MSTERELFEAWAVTESFNIDRHYDDAGGEYHRATTRWAWRTWQAARSADTSGARCADARQIDWLDAQARRPGGILLHAESETGRCGLGLGPRCGNRHLRKAISQAMGGEPPPSAPGGPAGARRPDDQDQSEVAR